MNTSKNPENTKHQLPMVAAIFLILAILVVGLLYLKANIAPKENPQNPSLTLPDFSAVPLFSQTLAEAGIKASHIGFHGFSPDGKYFFFTTFTQGKVPGNKGYLLHLADNTIEELPGIPERGITDSRVLQLFDLNGNTILYFPETKVTKTYAVDESTYAGFLSPDGLHYAVNTAHGIKLININTNGITQFSTRQYDGAYAWFSDSKRMLGFKETDEELMEAGKARVLGIWNIDTGTFESLPQFAIQQKTIRYIEWLKQDEVARVNTGWDDGSYDYLIDLKKGTMVALGDTSGALMSGILADKSLELFAVVRPEFESTPASAVLYDANLKEVHSTNLAAGFPRENMRIVDKNNLLYVRKTLSSNKEQYKVIKNELVKLDLRTGTETALRDLPSSGFIVLSLAPDHKTWVISTENQFISGTL